MSKNSYHYRGYIYKPIPRAKLSDKQQDMLNELFDRNPYPNLSAKRMISKKTGLDIDKIRVWFQNKRARMRFSTQIEAEKKSKGSYINNEDVNDHCGCKAKEKFENSLPGVQTCRDVLEILRYCNKALSGILNLFSLHYFS